MSWFDTAGFASLAKSALSTAQKTIDKALDIQDEKSRSVPAQLPAEKEDESFFGAFGLSSKKNMEKRDSPTSVKEPDVENPPDQSKSGLWGDWGSFASFKSQDDTLSNPEPKKEHLSEPETSADSQESTVLLQPQRELLFPGCEPTNITSVSGETEPITQEEVLDLDQVCQEPLTVSLLLAELAPMNLKKQVDKNDTTKDSVDDVAKNDAVQLTENVEQDLTGSTSSNDLTLTEQSDGDASPSTSTVKCEINDMSPADYCIVDQPSSKRSFGSSPSLQDLYQSEMSSSCSTSMEMIHENDVAESASFDLDYDIEKTITTQTQKKGPMSLSLLDKENLNSQYSSPDSVIAVLDGTQSTLPSPYYPDIHIVAGDVSMITSTDQLLSSPATGESSDQDIVTIDPPPPKCEAEPTEECETSSSASKGSCTSSGSFVNCSAEDADNCYRETSPSSTAPSERSDAMRPGGEFSGHTSGDEIETATSSDIEILSPPNGENGDRHPTSPLKHIWAPRPHRLRCSESPASDGGKDTMPVLHEREELLRACGPAMLSSRNVADVMEGEEVLKRLVALQELLEARENRVLELSKENVTLQEESCLLKSRIQKMESTHSKDSEDVSKMTKEFSQRLSQVETSLREVTLERDELKNQLQEIQVESANRLSAAVMETMISEKDQQISELMKEGEKLSKQQLQLSNIIKKLRNKEKENEAQLKTQREKLEERSKELERLRKSLGAKDEQEKKHIDAIRQLTATVQRQDDDINNLKSELEDSNDKLRSMKNAMDSAYKEMTGLQKEVAEKESSAQEAAISAEMSAKEEIRHQLQHAQDEAFQERGTLLIQICDLKQTLMGVEQQSQNREEALKLDISSLQKRLQESDVRHEELTKDVSFATRPLLRQIENLQNTYSIQSALWEKTEKSLLDRLNASQRQLALLTEKECAASARLTETVSQISTLQTEKRTWGQEKTHLSLQMDILKSKAAALEEIKNREVKAQENMKIKFAEEITALRHEKEELQQKIDVLNKQIETARRKEQLAQQLDLQQSTTYTESERSSPSPSVTISHRSSISRDGGSDFNVDYGGQSHAYENWWGTGTTSTIENLQSQVKRKEGEINQLQAEIGRLEKIRSSMEDELVTLGSRNEQLEVDVQQTETLKSGFTDLEQKYNTLLQMYGEKVEEAEELRLDLSDIKTMYRLQLDELMKKS